MIDSGTGLIFGPAKYIRQLNDEIGATAIGNGMYIVKQTRKYFIIERTKTSFFRFIVM